jgi:class 3 adenylate cyclase/DNA-binding NarL/FixJ family response regulator
MNNRRIYIAESSRILSKQIAKALSDKGFSTQIFTDGLSALKKIVDDAPDLIVADKSLDKINGIQLCKIIKNGSTKSSVPFILISTDEDVFDFWNRSTGANKTLSVSAENFESLIDAISELLDSGYINEDSFFNEAGNDIYGIKALLSKAGANEALTEAQKQSEEEEMTSWIVNAMERSESFLQMTNNVIKLYSYVKDTDALVKKLFTMIYDACKYDAIALILDSQKTKVYKAGTEYLEEGLSGEFWNICKTSYEQQAKKKHTITYVHQEVSGIVPCDPQNRSKLKSYYDFVIETDDEFVGTLHVASSKKKLFTYKVQSSIEYILPPLAYLLQQSIQFSAVTLTESKLHSAFLKFVPPQVIDDMLTSDESEQQTNNNEKRNVVILMSDIRNFTSISEENSPEDVVYFLNTYFTQMVNIVKKYGGTVDKFIGDAVMVLFGAPISYTDNAKRAVLAAIEMCAQLNQIPCGQLKFPEGVKLDIGIGIHYGDVIVGNIGSEDKTNYTVIGDTVNLASRLEGLTKLYGAKILVSQAVKEELDDSVNLMLLDSVKVKGRKESVQVYRVDDKPLPEDFMQIYEKGFKTYNEGAFSLAVPYFEKALEIMPDDKAAKLLLGRCAEFAVNKPENWDGAIALTSK